MQFTRVEICGVNTAKLKVLKEEEKMEEMAKVALEQIERNEYYLNMKERGITNILLHSLESSSATPPMDSASCCTSIRSATTKHMSMAWRYRLQCSTLR